MERNSIFVVLAMLLLCNIPRTEEGLCKSIQVSTNISETKDNIIKDGETLFNWRDNTTIPVIVNTQKRMDYIYVTVENYPKKLDVYILLVFFKLIE